MPVGVGLHIDSRELNHRVKRRIDDVENALTDDVVRDEIATYLVNNYEPYVPASKLNHKHLYQFPDIHDGQIIYTGINNKTGFDYSQITYEGTHAYKGFNTSVHSKATSYWDEAAWEENESQFLKDIARIVRRNIYENQKGG